MTQRMNKVVAKNNVAVITGAAKGIGAALARELHARGMKLALLDSDAEGVSALAAELGENVVPYQGDVTSEREFTAFRDAVIERFGSVHLLVNNVGATCHAGPWDALGTWRRAMAVNFESALLAQHLFVPAMIAGSDAAAVVNLGSKEGITTPPGNAGYSTAKAALNAVTEQLAHELHQTTQGRVSAHLLVPGYTWTPMNFPGLDASIDAKPAAPWTAEQVVDYFLARLLNEDFYIICPDNEVSAELDAKRFRWSVEDMIQNRPALSRWHPAWQARFADWLKS
ncbi:oxidoreductase [Stenotrophomonas sp. ESTM1D_MKCIP4_1]|nr:oxidoreductase [Stenotrophomonas sp. ESTM1D_MKCIP4_1]